MRKSTALLLALICLFMGAIWGFMLSPVKNGINVNVKVNGDN